MIRATSALLAQPYGVSARSATPIWSRSDPACAWTWASIPLRGVTVCARHIILHGAAVLVVSRPRRARRYFGYFVHVRLWPYSPPPRAPNRPYLATYLEQALQQQIDVDDRVPSFLLCWPLCLVGVAVARELVARSLTINQQIGNRAVEASTWHQLASIDLQTGDYAAARELVARSLTINQQIGNRAARPTLSTNSACWPANKGG